MSSYPTPLTADAVPIGSSFLGTADYSQLYAQRTAAKKPVDGALIRVALVDLRGFDLQYLLNLHADHLASCDSAQLSDKRDTLWVVGTRPTRSKKVIVEAVKHARHQSLLEEAAGLLRKMNRCNHWCDLEPIASASREFIRDQVSLGRLEEEI